MSSNSFPFIRSRPKLPLWQRKTPDSFLPGVLSRCVRRSGSEVTLSANVEGHGVLVLELVGDATRLRSTRSSSRRDGAGVLLIEVGPHDFRRERQVLDRSPAGNQAELRHVEVRVAAEVGTDSLARSVD